MSKKKTTIVEETKTETNAVGTYEVPTVCKNCKHWRNAQVPIGQTVESYSGENPCPYCGIKGMEKTR